MATAAVAPERVQRPPRLHPFAGLPGPLGQLDPSSLRHLRDLWEAVDNRWNVWVLQYSRGQQMSLLKSLGWEQPDMQSLGQALGWGLGALGIGAAIFAWWTRERSPRQPWRVPLMRVHKALQHLPVTPPPGPEPAAASAWRATLQRAWPDKRTDRQEALVQLVDQLDALRYGWTGADTAPLKPMHWLPLVRQIEALSRESAEPPLGHGAHSRP